MATSIEKREEKELKTQLKKGGMGGQCTVNDFAQLSKFFRGEYAQLNRSDIRFADYNPRTITEENLKTLRRGIRKYGMVGGIVVNKQTGYTLVQGHQRLTVMDELQKYNAETQENDYSIRCDVIDVDEKSEKELVILLNNPNAQGQWDYERLRDIVPLIDYKDAGLTEADMSIIGVDFLMPSIGSKQTETGISQMIMPELLMPTPIKEKEAMNDNFGATSYEEKKQHMKEVKEQVRQQALKNAGDKSAYVVISFDNYANMQDFLDMFGYSPDTQIIKGEEFATMLQLENEE